MKRDVVQMEPLRIYIDTSVLGGCFDVEFAEWSNGIIRDFRAGRLVPVLSDMTAAEVTDAPAAVRELHQDMLMLAAVDALVSWNFRHIVRLEKIRLFNAVNVESGYRVLNILSPREVTTHEST